MKALLDTTGVLPRKGKITDMIDPTIGKNQINLKDYGFYSTETILQEVFFIRPSQIQADILLEELAQRSGSSLESLKIKLTALQSLEKNSYIEPSQTTPTDVWLKITNSAVDSKTLPQDAKISDLSNGYFMDSFEKLTKLDERLICFSYEIKQAYSACLFLRSKGLKNAFFTKV